jgi:hypothetical protein
MFWVNARLPEVIERVDTIEKVEFKWKDTIVKDTVLVPKYIKVLKRDTVVKKDSSEVILETESKQYTDTITTNDGDSVVLNQWIHGIEASLDSTSMMLKKKEIIKTIEVTKYIEKPKTFLDRIHIQPQITSGFDLVNHQWGITAGIGFGIDL